MTARTKSEVLTNGDAALPAPPAQTPALEIERISPNILVVTIKGITPLVVNAWSHKAKDMIRGKQTGTKKKGAREAKKPEEDYLASRYISTDGWDGVPAGGVKGCLVNACRATKGDLPMTEAKRMFFVMAEGRTSDGQGLVRIHGKPRMYEAMVRVGMGVADIRYRAMYEEWSMKLSIQFLTNLITPTQLGNLVELAGFVEGLCEHRPGSPKSNTGDYGRFVIEGRESEERQ